MHARALIIINYLHKYLGQFSEEERDIETEGRW